MGRKYIGKNGWKLPKCGERYQLIASKSSTHPKQDQFKEPHTLSNIVNFFFWNPKIKREFWKQPEKNRYYIQTTIWIIANFSQKTTKSKWWWNDFIKIKKEKVRTLYSGAKAK